jgi:Uma2 family endonuclease
MGTPTRLITYEDSLTLPENRLEEIVHGESRIMPPADQEHADLIEELFDILKSQLDSREYHVTISGRGLGIERTPLTYRIPDLMVLRQEARQRPPDRAGRHDPYLWTPPDLLVECLSPSNRKGSVRDLLSDYAQIAVPEVWLLDPAVPQFTSHRYENDALREWKSQGHGVAIPLLLPNVTVDLDELWVAFHGRLK